MRDNLKIVFVGHVDHGKSTMIGRLLYDTNSIPKDLVRTIKKESEVFGHKFEFAYLLDAMEEERRQSVTIDTAQIHFKTNKREYTIIDAPGHREFIKNMVTGAASADAAILMIDADEGVQEQSKSHCYILKLLGIKQIVVAINKMDLVGYNRDNFDHIVQEYKTFLDTLGVYVDEFIPVSAKYGDNITKKSSNMDWYLGKIILEILDDFRKSKILKDSPLRLPVQDIYKFDQRRIISGRLESGLLKVGQEVMFLPSNKKSEIKTIEAWQAPLRKSAVAGESIGITLKEQIFVERGEICTTNENPPCVSTVFSASIFWMGNDNFIRGKYYKLRLTSQDVDGELIEIRRIIDTSTLNIKSGEITKFDAAEVVIRTTTPIVFDNFSSLQATGRIVIFDNGLISGGGIITSQSDLDRHKLYFDQIKSENITWSTSLVSKEERKIQKGHDSAVIWLTGLPGSGKSCIAKHLERSLFERNCHTYRLDGDNIRHGLNSDLGFNPEERIENIRRIGEVAKLFSEAGNVVITSFISPYKEDRDQVRSLIHPDNFVEVFVKCPLHVCVERDPRGLYKKALSGEIKQFTGITAPYDEPESPEIIIDTSTMSIEDSVKMIIDYLIQNKIISP